MAFPFIILTRRVAVTVAQCCVCVLMSCQQNVYNNVKSSLNCLNYANRSAIACNMQTNNSFSFSFFLRFFLCFIRLANILGIPFTAGRYLLPFCFHSVVNYFISFDHYTIICFVFGLFVVVSIEYRCVSTRARQSTAQFKRVQQIFRRVLFCNLFQKSILFLSFIHSIFFSIP